MRKLILFVILGLNFYSESYAASEQVFKVNNTLAQMDVETEAKKYVSIIKKLEKDIKGNGVNFSYKGSRVSGEMFILNNPKAYVKKEVLERYRKYSKFIEHKTIWSEMNRLYGYGDVCPFGDTYLGYHPNLALKVALLDANSKVIDERFLFPEYIGTYEQIFEYLNQINSRNQGVSDMVLYDKESLVFRLSLKEIKKIALVKFSVIESDKIRECIN